MIFPFLVCVLSLAVPCLAADAGDILRSKVHPLLEEERDDFGMILGATLTLLGLLIGSASPWPLAGTISARITRRLRPTRSARSTCGRTCFLLKTGREWHVFLILPIAVSIAFFLISDIDSHAAGRFCWHPRI